ncbi:MAG: class I SAM-dependent methyltransferase [Pirellulales bacterium]
MSVGTDDDDYAWLVGDDGRRWLAEAATLGDDPLRLQLQLRRHLSPRRAALVSEQVELRRRARRKFRQADAMFFTRQSLEQATDEWLAAYKASRWAVGGRVVDLCCGLGGDLAAAARHGGAWGIDRDPVLVRLARANAALANPNWAALGGETRATDAESIDVEAFAAWHADPDRRATGRKITSWEAYQPGDATLRAWAQTGRPGALKLAPATEPPDWCGAEVEREWLGSRGECRQQVLWLGAAARNPGRRTATVCDEGVASETLVEDPAARPVLADGWSEYVFEAHAAVLAADLTATLAVRCGLAVWPGVTGYFTGTRPVNSALVSTYRVLDVLPFDRRQVRQWLRAHAVGRVTIKKRGVDLEVPRVERELAGPGDESAVLLIAPSAQGVVAVVAQAVS